MTTRTEALQELFEGFHALKQCTFPKGSPLPGAERITGAQWLVLGIVRRADSSSVKDIARALHMSSSAATQTIAELVKHGWVTKQKDPIDGRSVCIVLSKKAQRDLARLHRDILSRMERLFAVLSDREFATYIRLQKKIIAQAS